MQNDMANLTYRDIPLLQCSGFTATGCSWFKRDKHGQLWQVTDLEDDSNLLTWRIVEGPVGGNRMSRELFEELFV